MKTPLDSLSLFPTILYVRYPQNVYNFILTLYRDCGDHFLKDLLQNLMSDNIWVTTIVSWQFFKYLCPLVCWLHASCLGQQLHWLNASCSHTIRLKLTDRELMRVPINIIGQPDSIHIKPKTYQLANKQNPNKTLNSHVCIHICF